MQNLLLYVYLQHLDSYQDSIPFNFLYDIVTRKNMQGVLQLCTGNIRHGNLLAREHLVGKLTEQKEQNQDCQ